MTNTPQDSANHNTGGPLFFQRRFWPMWVALSAGTFADNTLRQALLIGVSFGVIKTPGFENGDNSIPFIGALLPFAIMIFSSISGQLADKYETSLMFRRTKLAEVMMMLLAAFAFSSGNGLLATMMLFGMGAQSAFFSPVRVGAMPKYLQPDELVRGNGMCNAGLFTCILLGYAVGGYLIVQDNGGMLVGIVLVSASLLGFSASVQTPFAAANAPDLKLNFNVATQTLRMFRIVTGSRGVAPPLLGVGVFYLLSTAVTVITPLYARDALNADALVATALNGLFAVGAGVGAVTAANFAKGHSGLAQSTVSVGLAGILSIVVYLLTPFAAPAAGQMTIGDLFGTPIGLTLCAAFIATAALMGVYIAPLQAAMQRRAPAEVRARIMAAGAFMNAAFAIPGSLAIFAITSTGADPRLVFLGVAAAMLVISAYMLHRRRTLPAGLYDEMLASAKTT
jgi:MFS family permease